MSDSSNGVTSTAINETFATGNYNITIYPAGGAGTERRPVLLLLHGNTGLFYMDHGVRIHGLAEKLAGLGYVAAVPQYYRDNDEHLNDQTPGPHVKRSPPPSSI